MKRPDIKRTTASTPPISDADVLPTVASLIGGSLRKNYNLVRLPARLARGEVFPFSRRRKKGVMIELRLGSSLYLVIGGPGDPWSLATTAIPGHRPSVYYAPDLNRELTVRQWLEGGGSAAIETLRLDPDERVHIYASQVRADLWQPVSAERVVRVIENLVALARTLPPPPRQRRAKLPNSFADLQPLVRRWAIPDDHERTEAIDRATRPTLRRLVGAVKPRLAEINTALDSAEKPLPYDLVDLQTLGEAALEAEIELNIRHAKSDVR